MALERFLTLSLVLVVLVGTLGSCVGCPQGCDQSTCDSSSSTCSACVTENYGVYCNHTCPTACPEGSSAQCDRTSGLCNVRECLVPYASTCDYYNDCLESLLFCGASGYPVAYGTVYCSAFKAQEARFSLPGQAFIESTLTCLQKSATASVTAACGDLTCQALEDAAFLSHPPCYIAGGVCEIPGDWPRIVWIIKDSLFTHFGPTVAQIVTTLHGCLSIWGHELLGAGI